MFDWIPEAAREMRAELVDMYWTMLVIVTLFVAVFEFFKMDQGRPDPNRILKRVVLSIIMLWSFDETVNLVGALTDGIAERIGGTENLKALFAEIKRSHGENSPGLFQYRQMLMYYLSAICYIVALVGYFVTDVSIHFVYTVLYVLSPLMILAYVPEGTAHITANLYRGILQVSLWKVLWCLMGNLLFRLADVSDMGDTDNMIMRPVLNIIIAISMFRIPFFASSLLGDGLLGTAKGIGQGVTLPLSRSVGRTSFKAAGGTGREAASGFRGTRKSAGRLVRAIRGFGSRKQGADPGGRRRGKKSYPVRDKPRQAHEKKTPTRRTAEAVPQGAPKPKEEKNDAKKPSRRL